MDRTGLRMFSVSPIFAPDFANWESYWRSTPRVNVNWFSSTIRVSRVIIPMVSKVLAKWFLLSNEIETATISTVSDSAGVTEREHAPRKVCLCLNQAILWRKRHTDVSSILPKNPYCNRKVNSARQQPFFSCIRPLFLSR